MAVAKPTVPHAAILFFSFFFLLFINASQPHRVHHAFESAPPSEDHGAHHGSGKSEQSGTECLVLSVSQTCHLHAIDTADLVPVLPAAAARNVPATGPVVIHRFASVLQRAPPDPFALKTYSG